MAYVIYQANQRKSAANQPADSKCEEIPKLIHGVQSPFTLRHRKEKKVRSSKSKTTPENRFTIPLRVHISLSVPPPSPNGPCTTPDELSDEADELERDIGNEPPQNRRSASSMYSKSAWSNSSRSNSVKSMRQNNSKHLTKNLDLKLSRSGSNRSQSAKYTRPSQPSLYTVKPSRSSTPSKNISGRKQPSIIRIQRGSPEEALQVRKCSQYEISEMRRALSPSSRTNEHKITEKRAVKVRKSDNAFVMTPNGSVKKCTVYIPLSNEESPYGKSVETREYEIIETDSEEECKNVNRDKKRNSKASHTVNRITEKIKCADKKREPSSKHSSANTKKSSQLIRKESSSKIIDKDSLRDPICSRSMSGDRLLPQNQYNHKEEITMSDVLTSLNSLNRKQSSHHELIKKHVKNKKPFPSKSNLKIWDEQMHANNDHDNKQPKQNQEHTKSKSVTQGIVSNNIKRRNHSKESSKYKIQQRTNYIEHKIKTPLYIHKGTSEYESPIELYS